MGTLEVTEVLEWPRIGMVLRLPLLSLLALLLLARTAFAGQCMVSGDCVITGTVNGEWNDDWGCDNVNACWDEAACCDRLNGNWEYCQNGAGQHMCTTFTDTGKQCCKGDNGGDGTTAGTDPTPATTRDPNNNCPGGNLEACISLCPEEDADIYQACVHDCMENC